MIIDCISDLHGYYPKLEGGDLLIVAGDLTAMDTAEEHAEYIKWQYAQNFRKIIFIAGNHDNYIQNHDNLYIDGCDMSGKIAYLCDSGTEFEGLKIWGSPWTKSFPGMNPKCKAFTVDTEEELAEKWALIPSDTDILITHCPPYSILDEVKDYLGGKILNVGSKSLSARYILLEPILHVFGHIHEHGGKIIDTGVTKFVNASHVNERYEPVNNPIRIELDGRR